MLQNLLGHLDGVVYRCRNDECWTTEFASPGCANLFDCTPAELIGKGRLSQDSLILAEDRSRVRSEIMEALRESRRFFSEYRVATRGGVKWVWDRGSGVFDAAGNVVGIEGFVEDITERKLAQEALRLAEERYRGIFEHAVEGIFQSSPDGRYLRVNPAFARIMGYDSPQEFVAELTVLDRVYVDPGRREEFVRITQSRGAVSHFESRVYRKDGRIIWVSESARAIRNEASEIVFFEGTVKDVTDSKHYQQQLLHQANHDALTGLPNRTLLTDRLDQALRQGERHQSAVAVAVVDLDQFKFVNDTLGHNVGDALLKAIAERLRNCVRDYDTVARQGGDEFVLIISGLPSEERISEQMKRILAAVSSPWSYKDVEFSMSCSIGLSLFPRDGQDAETLLMNADAAMYRAKETGRNNFQFYSPDMSHKFAVQLETQGNLRRALERDEFRLYYQPKLDLRTSRVIGLEALIRWESPGEGLILPNRFVPIAEETGLIVPIGEWVLHTACRQVKELQNAGFPPVVVSVNLSPAQFRQGGLSETVARILADTGLGAELSRTGSHRKPCHARRRQVYRRAAGAQGPRHPARDRRFRHRVFEPQLPEALPHRPTQDRSVVRVRYRARCRRCSDRESDHHARSQPESQGASRRRRKRAADRLSAQQPLRRSPGLLLLPAASDGRSQAVAWVRQTHRGVTAARRED